MEFECGNDALVAKEFAFKFHCIMLTLSGIATAPRTLNGLEAMKRFEPRTLGTKKELEKTILRRNTRRPRRTSWTWKSS